MKVKNPYLLLFLCILICPGREVTGLKCPGKCVDKPSACGLLGGKIIGYCINEQACCDYTEVEGGSCGTTITNNAKVSYFRSPNYPKESEGDLICEFKLNLNSNTLGVRLDFVALVMDTLPFDLSTFEMSQTPICGSDMMLIKGFKGWSPDARCGNLTGYSILVEAETDQKSLSVVFIMASLAYKWNIRLTQIGEEDVNSLHSLLYNNMTRLGNYKKKEVEMTVKSISRTTTARPEMTILGTTGHQKASSSNYFSYPPIFPATPHFPVPPPPYNSPVWQPFQPKFPPFPEMFRTFPSAKNDISHEKDFGGSHAKFEHDKMSRIAGGQNAKSFSIPWQVSIQSISQFESSLCGLPSRNMSIHLCGGSIIDEKTIISSAHCFYSPARYPHPTVSVDGLKVVVGELDMCKNDNEEMSIAKDYAISQVILHFNYFAREILNDLAIIRLREPIQFNQGVRPIILADTDFNIFDKSTLLSGWGSYTLDNENMTFPSILQKTSDLTLIPENECVSRQTAYLNYNKNSTDLSNKYDGVFDRGICARGRNSEVEAGFGDSGGPFVAIDEKSSTLIGVVSHMRAEIDSTTNETFHLDYFVKLASFKKWILMAMI